MPRFARAIMTVSPAGTTGWRCSHCRYDLTGLDPDDEEHIRCPECGSRCYTRYTSGIGRLWPPGELPPPSEALKSARPAPPSEPRPQHAPAHCGRCGRQIGGPGLGPAPHICPDCNLDFERQPRIVTPSDARRFPRRLWHCPHCNQHLTPIPGARHERIFCPTCGLLCEPGDSAAAPPPGAASNVPPTQDLTPGARRILRSAAILLAVPSLLVAASLILGRRVFRAPAAAADDGLALPLIIFAVMANLVLIVMVSARIGTADPHDEKSFRDYLRTRAPGGSDSIIPLWLLIQIPIWIITVIVLVLT
jgi:DNA-directed RNA polymerase subunit RPC12/RpoP